ncbi:arsenate reductase [Gordonia effusa NBRC 100432]|uniref:Arsenate reductase n=1 Tax=Gordonia effusa NBRC 100432 TaxID=1077974 RepID=H0R0X7_9ACTN|nr:low molecular weight phosphatase family protein [Gordonia effusa]GAB18728.1 arsenate reductase [Gordonia effusa NBRC 100432]
MTDRLPHVLFVCVSNRGKSVMAESISRTVAAGVFDAASAGTAARVGGSVNELSAQVLSEIGADVANHEPCQLTDEMMRSTDLTVVVGTAEIVDPPAGADIEIWQTDEPSLRGIEGIERMRLIRDDIARRVDDLTQRLRR